MEQSHYCLFMKLDVGFNKSIPLGTLAINMQTVLRYGRTHNKSHLKHSTTSFALSDHYILVDQLQTSYHGKHMVL